MRTANFEREFLPAIEEIIISAGFIQSNLKIEFLLEKLKVTHSEIELVHAATTRKRDGNAWHVLRVGEQPATCPVRKANK